MKYSGDCVKLDMEFGLCPLGGEMLEESSVGRVGVRMGYKSASSQSHKGTITPSSNQPH